MSLSRGKDIKGDLSKATLEPQGAMVWEDKNESQREMKEGFTDKHDFKNS